VPAQRPRGKPADSPGCQAPPALVGPQKQIHRIAEWLRLEGNLKLTQPQPLPWVGCPLPAQAAQGPIQPGPEHLQGWGTHTPLGSSAGASPPSENSIMWKTWDSLVRVERRGKAGLLLSKEVLGSWEGEAICSPRFSCVFCMCSQLSPMSYPCFTTSSMFSSCIRWIPVPEMLCMAVAMLIYLQEPKALLWGS